MYFGCLNLYHVVYDAFPKPLHTWTTLLDFAQDKQIQNNKGGWQLGPFRILARF